MKKGKFKLLVLLTLMISGFMLVGCGNNSKQDENKDQGNNVEESNDKSTENKNEGNKKDLPTVTIEVKGFGTMKGELYPDKAPNTVNNFITLANSGFYNGLTFHRIIPDFMIQGGDPDGVGTGGPGYSIKGEFSSNGFDNDIKHTEGILSMARSRDKDSAGSQFFIMTKVASHLDGEYAAFGKITEGLEVLHKIESIKTGANDKPEEPVVIESIKVDTKGINYKEPEKMK